MNKVFERNINSLKNNSIKDILLNYAYKTQPVLTSTNGYNIQYEGIYLHSEQNPIAESKTIFQSAGNSKDSIHLIYGLGLGYLFQLASLESKGTVVLYEPNLDILYNSFTLVDFSGDLAKNNVYLFTDFDELTKFIAQISNNDSQVEILSLPSYRNLYKNIFNSHTKALELAFGSVILDYGYKKKKLFQTFYNMFNNIPSLIYETPINTLENKYEGKTAVIVSAGPTLSDNIEVLKEYQNNVVIFSVGPALRTLVKNDIKADYLCIVESNNCSKQVDGPDLSDINLILEPFTNPAIHTLNVKKKYLHVSSNMPPSAYWGKIASIDTKEYLTQGTVSYMALNSAVKMGFSRIILVGQDLAYIDGQCYSKDSAYEGLVCKFNTEKNKYEITPLDFDKYASVLSASPDPKVRAKSALERLAALNNSLYTVQGISGEKIPTETGYAAFIKQFADYVKEIDGIEFINTSMKGAQIDGFKNISLSEVLKTSKPIEKAHPEGDYEYNVQEIITNLKTLRDNLKQNLADAENCGKVASRLTTDWRRRRMIDRDLLLKIRQLIETFSTMNDTSNPKNEVFICLTAGEEMELSDCLKTVINYDTNNTPLVIEKLKVYYTKVQTQIIKIILIIDRALGEIEQ